MIWQKYLLAILGLMTAGSSASLVPPVLNERTMHEISKLPLQERQVLAEALLDMRFAYQKRSTPTGNYAPGNVPCPAASAQQSPGLIRNATSKQLNQDEQDYINKHRQARQADWRTWLTDKAKLDGNGGIPGGVQNYTNSLENLPRIAFALSGGGLRAMLVGVGTLMGFDNRNETANERGTGGLLQLADYVAGLSGGSWATGSMAMNDWMTAQQLNDNVYNLEVNMIVPQDGKLRFYTSIAASVKEKRDLDYGTGITDYFGLSIAQKTLDGDIYSNKPATTFSDIRNRTVFQDATYPYPIIIAAEREPGELLISRNTSIWEFNPYEFGSWNPDVSAFIPIDILGSSLNNGASELPDNQCVAGFESFPWVVGTSASLFSGLYLMLLSSQESNAVLDALRAIAEAVSQEQNDISTVPNPFYGYSADQSEVANLRNLTLVDGGLDNQNVPLWPLVEPSRDLDLIIAVDSSADVTSWPNGSSLYQTHLRALNPRYRQYPLPVLPDTNTVINRGLNTRPVFFGCDANVNVTNAETAFNGTKTPIIAYMPSYPYLALANTSTYKMEYSARQSQGVLDNSVAVATLNGEDETWATCLACAALQRGFERSGVERPAQCDECMSKWCWDGVTNTTTPNTAYSPPIGTPEFVTSNGTLQQAPPYTGGNGSNPQEGDSASVDSNGSNGLSSLTGVLVGTSTTVSVLAACLLL